MFLEDILLFLWSRGSNIIKEMPSISPKQNHPSFVTHSMHKPKWLHLGATLNIPWALTPIQSSKQYTEIWNRILNKLLIR